MSSHRSSSIPQFPEGNAAATAVIRQWLTQLRKIPATLAEPVRRGLDRWIRRRGPVNPPLTLRYRQIYILPTGFGWQLGVLLFAMLLGSLNFNNSLGLFTTFLVAGIGLLAMHVTHRNIDGLEITGCQAIPVFAGQPLVLRVRVREARDRARGALVIDAPGGNHSRGQTLEAGASVDLELEFATHERGWRELPRQRIGTRYPLGCFHAWSWFWPERRFIVWPRPASDAPPLPTGGARNSVDLPGDESDEFHGLRDWRQGDPLHRIAWKASQRHQHLLARQFTRPERAHIVLDLEQAPGRDLEQRISVLTRWVLEADRAGIDYGIALAGNNIAPGRGEAHRVRCLDALAEHR